MRAESGTSLIEFILGSVLLLMPMNLAVVLFQIQSDQLLAETIGRHALRSAVLEGRNTFDYQNIAQRVANEITQTWNSKTETRIQLRCSGKCEKGSYLNLIVSAGSATAVQSQVLDR